MPIAFVTSTNDTTNVTTYTFSAVPIGAAAADRIVIVSVSWVGFGGLRTISSASIGGIGATVHVQQTDTAGDAPGVAIISAAVPTGTTATISVTLSGTGGSMNIGVYRAVGLASPAPFDIESNVAAGGNPTVAIDIQDGGSVVAHCENLDDLTAMTWAGVDEDFDASDGDGSPERYSGGHVTDLAAQTGRTVSATGGAETGVLVAAAWADMVTRRKLLEPANPNFRYHTRMTAT